VNERLGGFEVDKGSSVRSHWAQSREALSFPDSTLPRSASAQHGGQHDLHRTDHYRGHAQLTRDIDNLKAALGGVTPAEVFMPAISPSNSRTGKNAYYKSEEEYLFASPKRCARIHGDRRRGFSCCRSTTRARLALPLQPGLTIAQCRAWAEPRIAALNHALRDIPPEKVRFHTCYSINMGPRIHDMESRTWST